MSTQLILCGLCVADPADIAHAIAAVDSGTPSATMAV